MSAVRLRQAVLAARELDPVAEALGRELGVRDPFADPGVGHFGLRNNVFALGDCFIEIVSPVQDGTAAGRHLDRHGGDGGYMVMFQLEDLEGARSRARELGVRTVWEVDLKDISDTHLHPADMRGAIFAIDKATPAQSWRWGGPAWEGKAGEGAPGELRSVTIEVSDPEEVAGRWAEVLGVPVCEGPRLELDGGQEVRFATASREPEPGLVQVDVAVPEGGDQVEIGGVRFSRLPL